MRCFIAIDLPKNVIAEIARIQELVKRSRTVVGTYVTPEKTHLTLVFLGDLDASAACEICQRLRTIKTASFQATLGQCGIFVPEQPRILWVALNGDGVLTLQHEVQNALLGIIEPDNREFVAHMTLVRLKKVFDYELLASELQKICVNNIAFKIESFALRKSELTSEGPVYTDIERFNLS